jgi:hypothetical protein
VLFQGSVHQLGAVMDQFFLQLLFIKIDSVSLLFRPRAWELIGVFSRQRTPVGGSDGLSAVNEQIFLQLLFNKIDSFSVLFQLRGNLLVLFQGSVHQLGAVMGCLLSLIKSFYSCYLTRLFQAACFFDRMGTNWCYFKAACTSWGQ